MSKIAKNLSICIFNVLLWSIFLVDNITKLVQIFYLNLYALLYTLPNKTSHVEIIY